MTSTDYDTNGSLLIMTAGANGAIGSTMAVASLALGHRQHAETVSAGLTTWGKFPRVADPAQTTIAGWDTNSGTIVDAIRGHGVLSDTQWRPHENGLSHIEIRTAPMESAPLAEQVDVIQADIAHFKARHPHARPVMINLLPAARETGRTHGMASLEALLATPHIELPDLAYVLAALLSDVPVVNFSPNVIELPIICDEAARRGLPLAGRDGKTGQTYFKVVLASAFKARSLNVDGWYSLNILGNADGKNLMDPERARGKLQNKTNLLDDILEYPVGRRYGESSHKVHIDYYPPRGDAKEAWDVIDFTGIFGLPMSMRLNLQGRDSILAAPMAIDLACWTAALHHAGIGGPIADLGFYFKKPVGERAPITFQAQLAALDRLAQRIQAHPPL
ncbi:MAG: hypothetical protein HKP58_07090 [Desulfatitalea sp.]|nr:inositol-3-phosphate synthase [Desulfatitalea sp.]NNK00162.1 hypothetical protein [Desulfatitalea sp.]